MRPSFLPAAFFFIFFTIMLLLPGSALPQENWLDRIHFDKFVHIGIFSLMVVLWSWGSLTKYPGGNRKVIYFIAGAMLAYGIGIEFIQLRFIPNRGFELADILADTVGVTLGVLYSSRRYIKKNRPL